jgi:hypothetical protein
VDGDEREELFNDGDDEKQNYFKLFLQYWPPLWSGGQDSWLLNGEVLCFLWSTNWIYVCYVEESRPPLWFNV